MKTVIRLAALAVLTLITSTTYAAVVDLKDALGPSGHYTTLANYQGALGGQPMTATQQAYAHQQDTLRLLGYMSELGGDFALGQMFYHIAYGIAPPRSGPDSNSGGSGGLPYSGAPGGLGDGGSDGVDTGGSVVTNAFFTNAYYDSDLDSFTAIIGAPEPSTWTMMALGFAVFGVLGWPRLRETASHARIA